MNRLTTLLNRHPARVGSFLTLAAASTATAQTSLFTTMDPSNSICSGYHYPVSTQTESRLGFPFVPTVDGQITEVILGLFRGISTNSATLEMYADNNGVPGELLGAWPADVPVQTGGFPPPVGTVAIPQGPTLRAGSAYYLVFPVQPGEFLYWYLPATCLSTPVANQVWVAPAGGPWLIDPEPYAAFAILGSATCYANCDLSTAPPILNVNDFICFQTRFAAGNSYANCDGSTTPPILNVNDFICFQTRFAAGCP